MNLARMRTDYRRGRLRRADLNPDPIAQVQLWLEEASAGKTIEPTAMSLATVGVNGMPRVRTVLLKGLDSRGFVFFTNLESRKARQIAENSNVSLLFPWLAMERQVIVMGQADKLSVAESFKYFVTRPRGSQLAAWVSQQSNAISSHKMLEMAWEGMKEKFGDGKIPLPPFWGLSDFSFGRRSAKNVNARAFCRYRSTDPDVVTRGLERVGSKGRLSATDYRCD